MTVTLYIVGHVVPEGLTVTVNAKATIHDLKQTVARDISIPAADFDLYLEGCVLGEAASLVAETALCEGDELLAKPSKQYEALVALKEMGLVCSAADLINKVLKSDAVARTDSEKAEVLRLMVTADPSVVNAKVALTTPLLEAVAGSLTNLASLLISYKADINATGADDIVPLHIAAQNGLEDIMELLLANGADPSRADLSGMRALSYASGEGRARGAEILLKNGVDPNAQDKRGYTPLHNAVMMGHFEVVVTLLDAGANLNAVTVRNWTPLDAAYFVNNTAIIDVLERHGAKRSVSTRPLMSPAPSCNACIVL
eukprot:TRINITY_DN7214_c0_g1_i1.p1 TRINITY_DN7214_c0_g1~~TRINITY_DN7214_c0_g1_i1.p1  ORF type:complete len:314 (+),score=76.52 TRINITY_DN7214_c0_g1_i1:520-1461(+)